MKILHVVNISFVLPYYLGKQVEFMQANQCEIYVACSDSDQLMQFACEKKIKILAVPILRQFSFFQDILSAWKICRFIRENKIDIVVGHTPKGALIGLFGAFLAGCPRRVYFRHGVMYETSVGIKRFFLKNIERFTGLLAKIVVCVSPSVLLMSNRERLSDRFKNIILYKGTCNGVDVSYYNSESVNENEKFQLKRQFSINQQAKVVGYVGRLVKDKGISELIYAWDIVSKRFPEAVLLLVGPLEKRDAISKEVEKKIKNHPTIIVTGFQQNVKVFYSIMDMFILPSFREGFPTVVLEASSMSIPVITTRNTGCIDSIVENETGIFTELSSKAIADAIIFYLENDTTRIKHGQQGSLFVRTEFAQEFIWDNLLKMYNNL